MGKVTLLLSSGWFSGSVLSLTPASFRLIFRLEKKNIFIWIYSDFFGFIWIWIYDHKASHASATFFSTMKHLRSGKSVSSSLPFFYFLVLALKRTKNVTIFLIVAFEVDSPHLPLCWLPGWAAVWIRSENSSLSLAPPWTKHATNYECTFSPLKHKQGQAIIPINAI